MDGNRAKCVSLRLPSQVHALDMATVHKCRQMSYLSTRFLPTCNHVTIPRQTVINRVICINVAV